eukprot:14601669-Alexandrium_andersonii.AAC.1
MPPAAMCCPGSSPPSRGLARLRLGGGHPCPRLGWPVRGVGCRAHDARRSSCEVWPRAHPYGARNARHASCRAFPESTPGLCSRRRAQGTRRTTLVVW